MNNPRHAEILDVLASGGDASVQDLADRFGVSLMTIRRDLAMLENEGELTRTHGGAVRSKAGVVEFAFEERAKEHAHEKQAIGEAVAAMIRPGMAVSLDTGTTTLEVARATVRSIGSRAPLTVLTSSLVIASALYAHDNIDLVLLGGTARKGSPDLTGWLTEENLKRFRVDLAVLGADGVSRDGVFTTDVNVARVSQAMAAGAAQTVLAVDHGKFEQSAFVRFASWSKFTHVVTDDQVPPPIRSWLNKAVKHVIYAKT